jgi:hypothetical protein
MQIRDKKQQLNGSGGEWSNDGNGDVLGRKIMFV